MRKAFTIVELITVIVIVAILSAVAIPRIFTTDKLAQAAEEIITNLRYAQHLALMEDQFDREKSYWERHRWRMQFSEAGGIGWAYTVYKDMDDKGNNTAHLTSASAARPCGVEIAVDPFTKGCMSARAEGNVGGPGGKPLTPEHAMALEGAALTINRDIDRVQVTTATCGQTIGFDEFGRPFSISTPGAHTLNYLKAECGITLTSKDNRQIRICVQPETGLVDYCTN